MNGYNHISCIRIFSQIYLQIQRNPNENLRKIISWKLINSKTDMWTRKPRTAKKILKKGSKFRTNKYKIQTHKELRVWFDE